jgi:glutaredoxin 3
MEKSVFYHVGCSMCISAEQEILLLMDKSQTEAVHLGDTLTELAWP